MLENLHEVLELQWDSPTLNVSCAISRWKVHRPFNFGEPIFTGSAFLGAAPLWLIPQLEEREQDNFIRPENVASPHWHLSA
ncbi:uncharacterized protein TNCV_2447871 [Trichonephila clavipes]|uniref:Uncharacterized protein n=1 Tax=Trichonephila clavipes TaxID=2585209 RepID=A0A8X6SG07_TRICX|nr:uncharacterized protein TNCV_2447871 [Trichonephila clavipes]